MGETDAAEVAKFEAMASDWWDPAGTSAPLHRMNPCRLDYCVRQIAAEHGRDPRALRPFEGLAIADVGCGGGLMAEPMARLGAEVTAVDAAEGAIAVARAHAEAAELDIDYRAGTAATLAAEGRGFDAVLALEIVEHVPDPASFARDVAALVRPGGVALFSTLNRTTKSWLLAIVGAERVLRWLPRGTHDWNRFLAPDELETHLGAAGLDPVDRRGMVFDPIERTWTLSARDLSVNYIVTAVRR